MSRRFPLIIGPTAGGKSAVAVELCALINANGLGPAEIITADSMQVFRGMDIGTAKPTLAERRGIPHHLIDVAKPTESFSVERWLTLARSAIDDIRARGGVGVVVGGTNLYVKALLEGLFDGPGADPAVRAELAAMDPRVRRSELERVDPAAAQRIHFNDERRTIRALEVFRATGTPISAQQRQWDRGWSEEFWVAGLEWETPALNQRINARVKQMVAHGLVEEVRGLVQANQLGPQAREALGYKQLLPVLAVPAVEQGQAIEEALERIKIETRRLAKNQRTWLKRFRAIPGSVWVEMNGIEAETAAQTLLDQWVTAS